MEIFGIDINPITYLVIAFVIMLASTVGIVRNVRYLKKYSLIPEPAIYLLSFVVILLWFFALLGYTEASKGPILDPFLATTTFSTLFLAGLYSVFWLVRRMSKK